MQVDVSQEQVQVDGFRMEFEVSLQQVAEIVATKKIPRRNCKQRIGVLEKIIAACKHGQSLCERKSELLQQELKINVGAGKDQKARFTRAVAKHQKVFERLEALRIAYIGCGLFAQQLFGLFVWWGNISRCPPQHEPSHIRYLAVKWGGLTPEAVEKFLGKGPAPEGQPEG